MNTALHASQHAASKRTAPETREPAHLSIQLPREDELHRLSLAERVALRVALRLILRAGSPEDVAERAERAALRQRVLAEHEAQRLRYTPQRML